MAEVERRSLVIEGTVQGVGFRPFAHRLATSLGLAGSVGNDGSAVWCEIEGRSERLDEFCERLQLEAPPLAVIDRMSSYDEPATGGSGFRIVASEHERRGFVAIPPDVAPCGVCAAEFADARDRRHRHVFTCCTDCGPRFTVADSLPYDRATTSMDDFPLCPRCVAEYTDPDDRRFHAQATSCPACGPELRFVSLRSETDDARARLDPLRAAIAALVGGRILAIKGLGGFQLVCRADDVEIVERLRHRKRREAKPLALLVASLDDARRIVELDDLGERALAGPESPIVLAPMTERAKRELAIDVVAPGSALLGVMLPSTLMHRALAEGVGVPLVCTSGNRSEEPIVIEDTEATTSSGLASIADGMLTHDRRIARRADDSVGQVLSGRFQLLRRARGFVPRSVGLGADGPPVLGVGAELKNTVCLATADRANVSVHLGDLENPRTLAAFEAAITDQISLSGIAPTLVVHDLHPEYLSTKFALGQNLAPTLGVQHHHAHLVSCLVDNGHAGPAIGVTFDGIGWGPDGSLWGGEFLIGDAAGYERAAHLKLVPLPGGAAAIRSPWRMAVAHVVEAVGEVPSGIVALDGCDVESVVALCRSGQQPITSSIGRLFDAVGALVGAGRDAAYEGQVAMAVEQLASAGSVSEQSAEGEQTYVFAVRRGSGSGARMVIDPGPVIESVVADVAALVPAGLIAARFHRSIAEMVVTVCCRLRELDSPETGSSVNNVASMNTVALTGGVFQNRLLVELVIPRLEVAGFTVLRHSQVPPNDGGISLGQVAIGRAHLADPEQPLSPE